MIPIKSPLALILPWTDNFSIGLLVPIPTLSIFPETNNKWLSVSPSTLKFRPAAPKSLNTT